MFNRRWFLTQALPKVGMSALAATVLLRDAKGDFIIQPKAKKPQLGFKDVYTRIKPNTVYIQLKGEDKPTRFHNQWIKYYPPVDYFEQVPISYLLDEGFNCKIPSYSATDVEKDCRGVVLLSACDRNLVYLRKSLQDFIDHVCEYSNNKYHLVDGINYFIYDKRINYPFTTIQSQGKRMAVLPYSFTDEDYKLAGISIENRMVIGLNSEALIKAEWDDGEVAIACVDNKKVVLGSIRV